MKNMSLETNLEDLQKQYDTKKFELNNTNGSAKDNIKRFNELRDELAEVKKCNYKLKNESLDNKQLNKEIDSCSVYIKKIKTSVGLRTDKGNESDLQDIFKSVSKLVARESNK